MRDFIDDARTLEKSALGIVFSRLTGLIVFRRRSTDSELDQLTLLDWGRRVLPAHFRSDPSQMHRWLAEQLHQLHTRRGTKINVIGPRGGAKSTVVSLAFLLRTALEGREPYIWLVSDTIAQAHAHLANLRAELADNLQIAKFYPRLCGAAVRATLSTVQLANGTRIEAYGTGQRLRGRRQRQWRPSLIVCDDLENDGHMQSAHQREQSHNWFHGTLLKAGDKHTNVINLATALHREALAMQLLETPGWIARKFRAIQHWPTNTKLWEEWERLYTQTDKTQGISAARDFYLLNQDAMHAGVELLWPAEEDLYTLMRMRVEEGHATFDREKQGSPIDPVKCEWPEEYFCEALWCDIWPERLVCTVIALDPSKGRSSRHGDYSAFVVAGVDATGLNYVAADLERRPTPQIVADGVRLCQQSRPQAFGVEANQFQELLASEFAREFARSGIRDCQPCAIHNYQSKIVRIRRLGPYLSQRRLRILRNRGGELLVNQLRDFPLGSHDDGPDALEMALRLLEELVLSNNRSDGLGTQLIAPD